jgi:hypothetical protein
MPLQNYGRKFGNSISLGCSTASLVGHQERRRCSFLQLARRSALFLKEKDLISVLAEYPGNEHFVSYYLDDTFE